MQRKEGAALDYCKGQFYRYKDAAGEHYSMQRLPVDQSKTPMPYHGLNDGVETSNA